MKKVDLELIATAIWTIPKCEAVDAELCAALSVPRAIVAIGRGRLLDHIAQSGKVQPTVVILGFWQQA
jgi:hypothetical protein